MTTHAFAPTFGLQNIFAPKLDRAAMTEELSADATEQTFALVKSGPPVPSDEVESHLDAVEVTVRWGTQILSAKHLDKGESFFVGEGTELALPEESLGSAKAPIVQARGEGAVVVLPPNARGTVTFENEVRAIEQLAAEGRTEITLVAGMSVSLEVGAVAFDIKTVRAGKRAPIGFMAALAGGATGFIGLSLLGHAAIVASLAMFMPKMNADDNDGMDRDRMALMAKFLNAAAEREPEQKKEENLAGGEEASGGSSSGAPHKGESGASGTSKSTNTQGRMAFKGNDDSRQLSRKEEIEQAKVFGLAGILASSANNDPNAPSTPWAQDFKGMDAESKWGKMFGQTIDDVNGTGVGLWGTGEGGGGTADVIGLDHINTVGGGGGGKDPFGIGKGDKQGMGNGHGPGTGGHTPKAPIMRNPTIDTNGRLPAEVIQRIVRQNFGRFRLCYEAGLRSNPGLSGRVATKFVIDRNGSVSQASDAGSDLPDQQVVSCIVRSFHNLSFPSPEGGIATVTYPIVLAPGE
ncbi:MAG: AgmX/PglI C-terminal domain-containing protein [Deltaproteobacteria bacterium]|nr:AgmX/PglI C-terminal domain-containing protein [Deltaproteobacteria bacterium]